MVITGRYGLTLCYIVSVQLYIRLYSAVDVSQLCLNNITLKILKYFIVSIERKETNKNTKHIFKCMQFKQCLEHVIDEQTILVTVTLQLL